MTITSRDEEALVLAHQAGDPEAFAEIVAAHRASLLAHAHRRLRNPDDARDALQETFLRAYRSIDRFGGELHFGAWLHRILDNVCNDEVSRRSREVVLLQRVGVPSPQHIDAPRAFDTSVESALASLSPSYREALMLRAIDDLPFEEVARRTGTTAENARARFHRARNQFRRVLDGPAAVFLPMVVFVSGWLRRFANPNRSTGGAGALGPAPTSPAASSMLSSPMTSHFVSEMGAAPERASVLAKILITVAAAAPVAAMAPSSTQPAPLVPTQVEAGSTTGSDTEQAAASNQLPVVVETAIDPLVEPPSPIVSVTAPQPPAPTSTTLAEATPVASDGPSDPSASDNIAIVTDEPSDSSSDPVGSATASSASQADASAPRSQRAHLTGILERREQNGVVVYRGEVKLVTASWTSTGWIGCTTGAASSDHGSSLQCWFYASDEQYALSLDAKLAHADAHAQSFHGAYRVDNGDADPIATSGTVSVRLELRTDTAKIDMTFAP